MLALRVLLPTSWRRPIRISAWWRWTAIADRALELVTRLGESSPNCAVLVTSSSHDGQLILRAMRAGAKEFLTQPMRIDDLLASLGRISERRNGSGREPPPRQPGRGRGRLAGRRGHHQPGREPGLRAGPEPEELGHAGRHGPLPGRRRRVPGRDPRLHAGRRGSKRHTAGLQPLEAVADETFLRRLPAAAARAVGRLR